MVRKVAIYTTILLYAHFLFFTAYAHIEPSYAVGNTVWKGSGTVISDGDAYLVEKRRPGAQHEGSSRQSNGSVSRVRVKTNNRVNADYRATESDRVKLLFRNSHILCGMGERGYESGCRSWNEDQSDESKPAGKPLKPPARAKISIRDLYQRQRIGPPEPSINVPLYALAGHKVDIHATAKSGYKSIYLLGEKLDIHIYPVRYIWQYGDGGGARGSHSGHIYSRKGRYVVSLLVFYRAKVNWGSGWEAATDEISLNAPSRSIDIFEWKVNLFANNCYINPGGVGC